MSVVTAIPLTASAQQHSAVPLVPAALQLIYQRLLRAQQAASRLRIRSREATALIAAAVDLIPGDTVASHRYSIAAELARGAELRSILNTADTKRGRRRLSDDVFLTLACGIAAARKQDSRKNVVLLVLEKERPQTVARAIGVAGAYKLPVVFISLHGYSVNGARRRRSRSGYAAYELHGVPRIPVDSSDAVAIYRVAHEALERARIGYGPAVIDCVRFPATIDAVAQLKERLAAMGEWSQRRCRQIERQVAAEARSQRAAIRPALPVHLFTGAGFQAAAR